MKFATPYRPHQARQFATKFEDESRTQQQFKKETDINNIMAKYKKTGMVTHINRHEGNFGDFSSVEEYSTSLNKIMTANESFSMIPSEVRNKFENDPGKLIAFLSDKKNDEEAIKLGLKKAPQVDPIFSGMEKALEENDKKREAKKSSQK